MDFTFTPPAPLVFGKSPEYYEARVADPFRRNLLTMETLRGKVDFGGDSRSLKMIFVDGQATEFEIMMFEKGDTFLGLQLPMRATKFQNELKKQNIRTKKECGAVVLSDHNVRFYIFEGEIATIRWGTDEPVPPTADQTEEAGKA